MSVLEVKDLIQDASDKSEYKVENLVALLKPEEKAKKSQKKQTNKAKGYVKNGKLYSPTGWRWDDDAKIWIPPEKK